MPVGLIHTYLGRHAGPGVDEQAALRRSRLQAELAPLETGNYPRAEAAQAAAESIAKWKTDGAEAEAAGAARRPATRDQAPAARRLYNAMIAPLVPYGIKGAIWYQGESNAGQAYQYRKLFPAMIQPTGAKAWGQGDFPFLLRAARQVHDRQGRSRATATGPSCARRSS